MRLTWTELLNLSLAAEDRGCLLRKMASPHAEEYRQLERRLDSFLQDAASETQVVYLEWVDE